MANPHLEYHLQLLNHLRTILVALGEAEQVPEESHTLFLERFDELLTLLPRDPLESQYLGQDLICQVIQRYPQIAHLVPRDLLWFFGGDCLHYMPDEELDLYQQLEERRYEAEQSGEAFDWHQQKRLMSQAQGDNTQH
ncbi:dehydrogenase [Pseudomonas shirazica]|nr:dehydrogenase [Pseudomonas shirazica]